MKTKLFLTGLAIVAATTIINAQSSTGNGQKNGNCKGSAFVDNNKDGVCDNYQSKNAGVLVSKGTCNGNGTGKGKGKCKGHGKGKNFVDANKNGVCDNAETSTKK